MKPCQLNISSFVMHLSMYCLTSLVCKPFEKEKGPGTHRLHMLSCPKNLRGLDSIVFFLVYLPFDLNSLSLCDPEITGVDGSTFKQDFEVAVSMQKGFKQRGSTFSAKVSAKVRKSSHIL